MTLLNGIKVVGQALAALTVTESVIEIAESERTEVAAAPSTAQAEEETSVSDEPRTLVEVIEVEANYLVKRIKELIAEGNVRKLIIRDGSGKYLLEIPLTIGVVAGGAFALTAPIWAALTTIAGVLAKIQIEVVRTAEDDEAEPEEPEA